MKKALSLILALVLCLSLCACGNSKKIALTKDNVKTYLKLSAWMDSYYNELSVFARVEAASTNFNYEDVKITFRVKRSGRCESSPVQKNQGIIYNHVIGLEEEITVTTDIAGNGSKKIDLDSCCKEHYQTPYFANGSDSTWEIIDISGYVVPAR